MKAPDLDQPLAALLFEHAPCWVAVIDDQHRLVRRNPAFVSTFGPSTGEPCYAVLKDRMAACEPCVAIEALAARAGRSAGGQGTGQGGRQVRYRVHAVPVSASDGEAEHVLLMAVDQTRQGELASELAQAERLASVGLTTSGLAHSIKNILAGLEGGMYLMTSGIEREDELRIAGAWEMVSKYIEQVSALVKNLLRYAKADKPERELVDPESLITEAAELYDSKAAMTDTRIERCVAPGLEPITVDREGLRACLANLMSNALDACAWDPNSDKEHVIQLVVRPGEDGGIVFEVGDNGMGITEENQRKVLRKSFTTKGMRGTGLGLLLTKKVVKEHGGSIRCTSTPGQGTTFAIELPQSGAVIADQQAEAPSADG